MTATGSSLTRLHVGTSGWSYPSWKPGFYPAELKPPEFLAFYARRFSTVELNTTGYRVPAEEQFRRWADATPAGFTFAPKLQAYRLDRLGSAVERIGALGDRLGPIRMTVQAPRDDGMLAFVTGSIDPEIALAWDFRHPSWAEAELPAGSVRVDDLGADAPFRYIRFRDPPYDDAALADWAVRIAPLLDQAVDVYCYFRHEDEPTGPHYAGRLLELFR